MWDDGESAGEGGGGNQGGSLGEVKVVMRELTSHAIQMFATMNERLRVASV